ncbi:MAG: alpha/beta hydrolase fold domain-containing protein [Chloroflexota bacterium]
MRYPHNQFYEEQYSTSIGFDGDENALFASWARQSEQARQLLVCDLAIPYGSGHRETIDFFFAENRENWLVVIHGGYWRSTASRDYHFIAPQLIQSGWNIAFIEYDLAPVVSLHTIVEQCRRAITWLLRDYHIPIERLIVSGHSAGGHLTGMMWTTDWGRYHVDANRIAGGIALSSLFDLDPIAHTNRNSDLKLSPDDVQQLSPARLKPTVTAPLVIATGALESAEFHRQSAILRGILEWQAITHALSLKDCHHYNILNTLTDSNSDIWKTLNKML